MGDCKMIDKMEMPTVPAQFDWRDAWTMWNKIQEIVEKVNDMERRIGGGDDD